MTEKNKIISLFSTPAILTNIGREFTEDELQFLLYDVPMWKDNEKGMQNHRSKEVCLFDNFTEELKDIKEFCEDELELYLEEIEGVDPDFATLHITESWINMTKPQEHHHPHYHGNSYLSGILYISCLPNDHIYFSNRMQGLYNNMQFLTKKNTAWNVQNFEQNVTEGDLIIFPSWIPHFVDVNRTKNEDRISLSFNTFPTKDIAYEGRYERNVKQGKI